MHANAARLLEIARTFSQIDLGVTIRRAYDTFCEQLSVAVIEWILDLTRSRLGTDTRIMREIIASQLLAPRKPSTQPQVRGSKGFVRGGFPREAGLHVSLLHPIMEATKAGPEGVVCEHPESDEP